MNHCVETEDKFVLSHPKLNRIRVYLLSGLSAFFSVFSACYAQESSHIFVNALVAKHNYSLSPSGNLLLMIDKVKQKTFLRKVERSGLGVRRDISFFKLDQVRWSLRKDKDELIGIKNRSLYRINIPKNESSANNYIFQNITPWPDLKRIKILQLPVNEQNNMLISAIKETDKKRAIYRCKTDFPTRGCKPLIKYDIDENIHLFDYEGRIVGRFRWTEARPDLVSVQVRMKTKPEKWNTVYSYNPSKDEFKALGFVNKFGDIYALSNRDRNHISLVRFNIYTGRETVVSSHKHDIEEVFLNKYTYDVLATISSPDVQRRKFLTFSLERPVLNILKKIDLPTKIELISTDFLNRKFIVRVRNARFGYATFLMYANGGFINIDEDKKTIRRYRYETNYVSPKFVQIPREKGPDLNILLTVPKRKSEPFPFVIMIHGGPRSQYRWNIHPLVQRLVSFGIAVMQINYRGSSGYGKKYESFIAVENTPLKSIGDDVNAAYRWLIASRIGLPGKAGIWGESVGATVGVQVAAEFPSRYPVLVLLNGMFDFSMTMKSMKKHGLNGRVGIRFWNRYMGENDETELLHKSSRLNVCSLATGFQSSILMFSGLLDRITHPDQSLAFHDELRERGVGSRLKILVGRGTAHNITSRKHVVEIFSEAADFFHKNLNKDISLKLQTSKSEKNYRRIENRECLAPRRRLQDLMVK